MRGFASVGATRAIVIACGAVFALAAFAQDAREVPRATVPQPPLVISMRLDGALGPAAASQLATSIEAAEARDAAAVVVALDTPGGLDTSTREMVEHILASAVPVVVWVSPSGARAASAGTFLVYASHVAAMAPATSVGAATPIELGPSAPRAPPVDDARGGERTRDNVGAADEPRGDSDRSIGAPDDMRRKAVNDAVAALRGLAELRHRNAGFAEAAVREGASLPAHEALARNVIDVVARDQAELLAAIDGRSVNVLGAERALRVENAVVVEIEPDWRTRILSVLGNPNVAYLLLMLGFYALLFELSNPGAIVPGVLGAVALLLALFSLHLMPVTFVGVALLVLGAGLLVAEVITPTFGALGIGGVISGVIGSLLLIDTKLPAFQISPALITVVAAGGALFVLVVLRLAMRQRRRPVATGKEQLLGAVAVAEDGFERRGAVRVFGERWNAESESPVVAGARVDVIGLDGLLLRVRPHGASS